MSNKIKHFWNDGISIIDAKVSALLITLLVTVAVAVYHFVTIGDITDNMVTLIGYVIMAVTGVSVTEKISRRNDDSHIGK